MENWFCDALVPYNYTIMPVILVFIVRTAPVDIYSVLLRTFRILTECDILSLVLRLKG